MVRTISKMFLKKRIVLTSLTTTLHFSRAHHWLLLSFPSFSTCSSHLYFPALVICYVHSRPLVSLCRPWHAFPASLSGCIFQAHIIGYFTIFPVLALPLSLLFYFPALVIWSVRSSFLVSFFPALQY